MYCTVLCLGSHLAYSCLATSPNGPYLLFIIFFLPYFFQSLMYPFFSFPISSAVFSRFLSCLLPVFIFYFSVTSTFLSAFSLHFALLTFSSSMYDIATFISSFYLLSLLSLCFPRFLSVFLFHLTLSLHSLYITLLLLSFAAFSFFLFFFLFSLLFLVSNSSFPSLFFLLYRDNQLFLP